MVPAWLLAATVCVICYLLKYGQLGRKARLINKIPGPTAYPIIGTLLETLRPTNQLVPRAIERKEKYGGILRLWFGTTPIVVISSAEYLEIMLGHSKEIKKSFMYKVLEDWLGQGLLTSYGSRWFKHRKLITPTFHFKILDSFIPVYENNCKVLIGILQDQMKLGEPFDIYPFINRCALDIVCETAMGVNLNAQRSTEPEYLKALFRKLHFTANRMMRPYWYNDFVYSLTKEGKENKECIRILHDFTEKFIKERRSLLKASTTDQLFVDIGAKKRKAFLDLLLDQNNGLSDVELRQEVDAIMFAGHDTTTSAINWTIYLLGLHPKIQEQTAAEVLQTWPLGEPLTMKSLNEMKLLERVIKESMRMYPPVPSFSRELASDLQFGDYLVPLGTTVSIQVAPLHMDEKVFPNPKKFDPDRFLPENVQKRHPYAYVPFSAGPRNCIGQKFALLEEKTVLASILREFKITSLEEPEKVSAILESVLRPENGIIVKLSSRNK